MKIKHKGKVYPSPSSSSPLTLPSPDALSILRLLPAAILALASVLSAEDKEVLAYMITRSIKTTTTTTNAGSFSQDSKKKSKKQPLSAGGGGGGGGVVHKPPLFDCGCFECYTCYWFRWDSSPNRELIHQAIEAFEDHLSSGEKSKRIGGRGKKKDRLGRGFADKPVDRSWQNEMPMAKEEALQVLSIDDSSSSSRSATSLENDVLMAREECEETKADEVNYGNPLEDEAPAVAASEEAVRNTAANNHKGLARKVLPDVLGLFNSRLWSLWSPNV